MIAFRVLAPWIALIVCAANPIAADEAKAPDIRVPQLERRIYDLINQSRTAAKLRPLQLDDRLTRIARAHSEDMASRGFFDHVNPNGDDPTARGRRAGFECRKVIDSSSYREGLAENLAEIPRLRRVRLIGARNTYDWNTPGDIAAQAVDGWMKSQGHRRNILEKIYTQSGLGIAVSREDVYVTQLFC